MSETLIAILGVAGTLLGIVVGSVLGRRSERHRQSLLIRAEMLKPIEEWLSGAEKMVGIFADTMSAVALNAPLPITYNLEERRKATQFMSEKTNIVLGILDSNSLKTNRTKKLAKQLAKEIRSIDSQVKFALLQADGELLDHSLNRTLTPEVLAQGAMLKLQLESQLQKAHALVAQIKTALT
jgi:4-hydroxy-3-methylbut-2-enyl diphosphate reductase IspH